MIAEGASTAPMSSAAYFVASEVGIARRCTNGICINYANKAMSYVYMCSTARLCWDPRWSPISAYFDGRYADCVPDRCVIHRATTPAMPATSVGCADLSSEGISQLIADVSGFAARADSLVRIRLPPHR